ncbi:MAG: hypothetical protein NE328_07285 [Lentisphaeraceae bacterium]|nr:hypothetical protein [Lentisphaeraceae bacterium]
MAKIATNNLKVGMVTLSETLDDSGHTLIRAKEELTDKHITLLKMWGVAEIEVKYSKQEVDLDILLAEYPKNIVNEAVLEADTRFKFFSETNRITHLFKKFLITNKLNGAGK